MNYLVFIKKRKKNIVDKFIFDDFAKIDLFQIHDYIYYNLQNPIAARNTAVGIQNKITILRFFPYAGKIYNQNNETIRFLIHKNYYIFYQIQEKENVINIKRILYKKRNLGKFL